MTIPRGARNLARSAAQPCIRLIREDRNHDAVMRIAAKPRGGGPILQSGLENHGMRPGHRRLGSLSVALHRAAKVVVRLFLSFRAVAQDAGRRTTPCGISPVVTRCQSAMSSLRASATIIVLRVLPRPSTVRASNHWARALFF